MLILILKVKKFFKGEEAITAIEYALLAALIVIVIVTAVATLGVSVLALFKKIVNVFP